jgi:hypothetical protein
MGRHRGFGVHGDFEISGFKDHLAALANQGMELAKLKKN